MTGEGKIFSRNYIICFFGTFLLYCSVYFLIPVLPLYLDSIGKSRSETGVIIGSFSATSIILRPMVGRLMDRWPKKALMVCGAIIFLAAPPLYLLSTSVAALILIRLFHGAGVAMYATAAVVTVAGVAPRDKLAHAAGIYVTSVSAAMGLAPLLGSYTNSFWSFERELFLLCFLAFLILLLSLLLQEPRTQPEKIQRQAFLSVLQDKNVLVPSLSLTTCTFSLGTVTAFLPLYVQSWGGHQTGLFFAVYSLVIVATRLLGGGLSDSLGRKTVLVPSIIAVFSSTLAFIFIRSNWSLCANAVFYAAGFSLVYPTLNALVVERVSVKSRGTALGILSASLDGGLFIGPATMGYFGHYLGWQHMFLAASLVPLAGALFFLRFLPARPDAPAAGKAFR
ncbi:MAG: MFS transporter [Eubacteriales bacterium]